MRKPDKFSFGLNQKTFLRGFLILLEVFEWTKILFIKVKIKIGTALKFLSFIHLNLKGVYKVYFLKIFLKTG